MELDYNLLNIFILFGALQGFVLCLYIYQKRDLNRASVRMFLWFLFSLSFLNMMYGFLDLDVFKYYRPLHLFPFPYKWIIGPAFYFYIKYQFIETNQIKFNKREYILFLPAIAYGILRLYWFGISINDEDSYRITKVLVESNYFRIQEIILLNFNIILGFLSLKFVEKRSQEIKILTRVGSSISWLKRFVWVFILINIFALIIFSSDLIIHKGKETFLFIYPLLIINVAYIYWIGFIGFSKPKYLFNIFKTNRESSERSIEIDNKLQLAMQEDELFTNANLSLTELAFKLEIHPKELSSYINEIHQMNFSEYLNIHRIEKVKSLLASEDAKKYTLVTLAADAGFNSKSSFNATFKKVVGLTPSEYRKRLQS